MISVEKLKMAIATWKSSTKDRFLYVHNVDTTWTRRDFHILNSAYEVEDLYITNRKQALVSANPFRILKYGTVFFWFGSLNFLPILIIAKLLRKEVVIVAGGFDVAKVPSINYGGFERNKFSNFLRGMIFKLADKVITVSHHNTSEAINNANVSHEKVTMIYHGFMPMVKEVTPFTERKNKIVSVGAINPETMKRKGHERFLKLARELPQFEFVLIGKYAIECKKEIEALKLKNLTLTGFLQDKELVQILSDSKFYVQLSEHEAFGCSVIEAGICGCNLIVSSKSALPEVVSDNGVSFTPDDIDEIKHYIIDNIQFGAFDSKQISEKLLEKFSVAKRKEALLKVFR